MNSPPPFTLRIRTEQEQDIDWMVQPDDITFHQALEVISRIVPDTTTTAFQYVDEDGEKITVRSDEELKAMFEMYFCDLSEEDIARGLLPPLVIYPRVGKTPKDRNIHDLKIKTAKTAQSSSQQHKRGAGSHNTAAENIKEILTCGRIMETDLKQISLVGKGNGGCVYKAFHAPSQRLMAVKVIQLDVDVDVQKKILSELEILYKCHSPAIIDFYGAFFIENRISICTEFMDGGSLDGEGYRPMPEEILGRMAVRIIQGLIYMWSQKILHRDIKPSNILVSTNGDVKLCDFGVSTQLVESIAMTFVGTNAYMAPERIKALNYGKSSEVWSLGVTLFELVTGQFPFQNVTAQPEPRSSSESKPSVPPMMLLKTILEGTTPVLSETIYSPELVNFVARCMQKQPDHRLTYPELLTHPFIQKYLDDHESTQVLSQWIRKQLPHI